jgi:SAM-dependent methyltransferase
MEKILKDAWESGDPYDLFMGRWSRLVARSFLDWLSPSFGMKWLDVGCGSGALSEVVINQFEPDELIAIDQSESFLKTARERLGSRAQCKIGNAVELPVEDSSVNIAISGLVLNFISKPEKALSEMKRVTTPGGTVAVYVWDYAGKMDFLTNFWDVVSELDGKKSHLHEGKRFLDSNGERLTKLFKDAGFVETVITPIEIDTHFHDFDDYWKPFLGGQGPAPSYLMSLNESERNKLRNTLYARLPIQPDGSIPLVARAWAVKSQA